MHRQVQIILVCSPISPFVIPTERSVSDRAEGPLNGAGLNE